MIVTIYGLCVFFKSSPGNKKASDSEYAVLIDSIYYTWQ